MESALFEAAARAHVRTTPPFPLSPISPLPVVVTSQQVILVAASLESPSGRAEMSSCRNLGMTAAASATTRGEEGGAGGGITTLMIQQFPTILMIILSPSPRPPPHDHNHPAPMLTKDPVPMTMIETSVPLSITPPLSPLGPPISPAFRPAPRHRQGQHYGGWGCVSHLFNTGAPTSRTPAVETARVSWGGGRRTADALHLHRKVGAVPNASGPASYLRLSAQQQGRAVAPARNGASSTSRRALVGRRALSIRTGSRRAAHPPRASGCSRRGPRPPTSARARSCSERTRVAGVAANGTAPMRRGRAALDRAPTMAAPAVTTIPTAATSGEPSSSPTSNTRNSIATNFTTSKGATSTGDSYGGGPPGAAPANADRHRCGLERPRPQELAAGLTPTRGGMTGPQALHRAPAAGERCTRHLTIAEEVPAPPSQREAAPPPPANSTVAITGGDASPTAQGRGATRLPGRLRQTRCRCQRLPA